MEKSTPIELRRPLKRINDYLQPFGLSVTLDTSPMELSEKYLGEYESGSVFTKEIVIRVNLKGILETADSLGLPYHGYLRQCELTVYHEVGHALEEQLIDWSENIDEMRLLLDCDYGLIYFDIFNDDCVSDEEIVEAFACGICTRTGSLLQRCWEDTNSLLNN